MTERQREDAFLSELLDLSEKTDQRQTITESAAQSILTRGEEQALLRAANAIGTPTLAPEELEPALDVAPGSFVGDLVGVARKHPALAVLAVGGIALLLLRRR